MASWVEELALDEPKSLNRSEKIKDIKELLRLFELKWNNEEHKSCSIKIGLEEIIKLSRYLVKELATAVKIQKENPSRFISHFLTAYFLIIYRTSVCLLTLSLLLI